MQCADPSSGIALLAEAMSEYMKEVESMYALCKANNHKAAIHERGKEFQLYRLYENSEKNREITGKMLRNATSKAEGWEDSPYWAQDGKQWALIEKQVKNKTLKHERLNPFLTRGISWEGIPVLVHAYKFEPDPVMKVELILPEYTSELPQSPLRRIASALRCHEHLVPHYIAEPLPPYTRHETRFSTIAEYLSRHMPKTGTTPHLFSEWEAVVPVSGI